MNFFLRNFVISNRFLHKNIPKNNYFLKYPFSTKLNQNQYVNEIQIALEHIYDCLDDMDLEIIESNYDSSGVLNFQITDRKKFVLNIQRPNQQLWLSSPISGPFRFEFDLEKNKWFDIKNNNELYELLKSDIDKILKENNINTLINF